MHAPYIVGRWVRGEEHYSRQDLIDELLTAQDSAYWLVSTRRMGKTSLLRHLELTALNADSGWIPLFLDIQGCATAADIMRELGFALEDAAERFTAPTPDLSALGDDDALLTLRRLARSLAEEGRQLLLLIDEAEALLTVAQADEAWVARLRKVLLEGHLRTVLASTRTLGRLSDAAGSWVTSPFLFGFRLKALRPFGRSDAEALVRQIQSNVSVTVDAVVMDEILDYTNGHPHLIQSLCRRLFCAAGSRAGSLRPIEARDLAIDDLLAAYLRADLQQLDREERQALLAVSRAQFASAEQLARLLPEESEARLQRVLDRLAEAGHLRRLGDQWLVGNEFLRRWLQEIEPDEIAQSTELPDEQACATAAHGADRKCETSSGGAEADGPLAPTSAAASLRRPQAMERQPANDSRTGRELAEVHATLLDAFTHASLRQMVLFQLDQQLERIAGGDSNDEIVFELVEWAVRNDRLPDLLRGACAANPSNQRLQRLAHRHCADEAASDTTSAADRIADSEE